VDYFPTLNPNEGPFLVLDLEAAIRHLELLAPTSTITPNEMFLSHAPGAEATVTDALWESLGRIQPIRVYGREAQLEAVRLDPLITAGWKAMVIMALAVIVLTASLGYTTYLLSFAGRSRSEMGFLQTLGLSGRQLLGLLGLEHLVIALFGLGLGTWAGFQMSTIMVRSVAVTERGNEVVPPFVVITDWNFMGPIYLILAAIFVVAVWVLHRGVAHLDLHTLARGEAV
jgi:putative ABC transport system permease protein